MNKYKKAFNNILDNTDYSDYSNNTQNIVNEAVTIIQELVDKQTLLTVNYITDGYADGYPVYDTATCPNCTRVFEIDYEEHYKYCPSCGQHLNWNTENKDEEKVEVEDE